MNQISAVTTPKEVDIPLKKERNPVKSINLCLSQFIFFLQAIIQPCWLGL